MRDRSGDLCDIGLVVYELMDMLSRAFSSNALAACAIAAEVPRRVVRTGDPGFSGRGGGARSGSELSHLVRRKRVSDGMASGVGAVERPQDMGHTWEYEVSYQLRKSFWPGQALCHGSYPFRRRTLCIIVVMVSPNLRLE